MESIWIKSIDNPCFGKLEKDVKTDVLIVGGGITGILCAYMLKKSGVECVVAEADKICSGTTKNTTAKITYQHGLIYDKMIKRFGTETARLYLEANRDALEQYRDLAKKISCDFQECDSYVYSLDNREKIENEVKALEKIGCPATFHDSLSLPFSVAGAVSITNQAQFNPLKFIYSVAKDICIYENTQVMEIRPHEAITDRGRITAEKIIVATHFPFINKHGGYFLKLYQHRSYVMAIENAQSIEDMYVDENNSGLSFRGYNGLLLLGGGGHRTGNDGGGWHELTRFAKKYYPLSKEVSRWATQDCMSLDDIPYIGKYSRNTDDMFVATGFNKWGMTSAMVSAMILNDMVCGKKNKYSSLFDPSRTIMRPQLAINAGESLLGVLRPTSPRCPHLGCALKYNPQEHSWDCPCHGSRFTKKGKLIDNPACKNAKIKNI